MDGKILQTLLTKENVVSVGRGYKRIGGKNTKKSCIIVGVRKKLSSKKLRPEDIIPQTVGNAPVETDVIEVGEISLL